MKENLTIRKGTRVKIANQSTDFFCKSLRSSYLFGTVKTINKKTATITNDDFRYAETTLLKTDAALKFLVQDQNDYYDSEGNLVYRDHPTQVELGDLVFCPFQDGSEHGSYFRGRVAKLYDDTLVDIAYDDDDYERKVPVDKLRWCESGHASPDWLLGVSCLYRHQTATIVGVEPHGSVTLQLTPKKEITIPYAQAIQCALDYRMQQGPLREYDWPTAESPTPKKRKKAPKKKLPKAKAHLETEWMAHEYLTTATTNTLPRMEPGLAMTLAQALDSSDSDFGLMLNQLIPKSPNTTLVQHLLMLLSRGPYMDGTHFPDPSRLTRTKAFLEHLWKNNVNELEYFAKNAPENWLHTTIDNIHNGDYFIAKGEHASTLEPVVKRYICTLHAKYHATWVVNQLLRYQMRDCNGDLKGKDREAILQRPLLAELKNHRRGSKEALETIIKTLFRCLFETFRFRFDQIYPLEPRLQSSILEQSRQLWSELGTLCSLLAQLYSLELGGDPKGVTYLMKNMVQSEMQSTSFDPEEFVDEPDYMTKVLFQFVYHLEPIVPQLRPHLADALGVSYLYNIIYEL